MLVVAQGHHQQSFLPLENFPDAHGILQGHTHTLLPPMSSWHCSGWGEVGSELPSINSGLGLTDLTDGVQVGQEARCLEVVITTGRHQVDSPSVRTLVPATKLPCGEAQAV